MSGMFKSRKFRAFLIGVVGLVANTLLGLPENVVTWIGGLTAVYIGGVAVEDGMRGFAQKSEEK